MADERPPIDRRQRHDITAEQRAEAVAAIIAGTATARALAAKLGVSRQTVQFWHKDHLKAFGVRTPKVTDFQEVDDVPIGHDDGRDRSRERIARYVYDAIIANLQSIANRARSTARPGYIERQSADQLARLDEVAWNQVARFIRSLNFEPDELEWRPLPEPDPATRNGSLDAEP